MPKDIDRWIQKTALGRDIQQEIVTLCPICRKKFIKLIERKVVTDQATRHPQAVLHQTLVVEEMDGRGTRPMTDEDARLHQIHSTESLESPP